MFPASKNRNVLENYFWPRPLNQTIGVQIFFFLIYIIGCILSVVKFILNVTASTQSSLCFLSSVSFLSNFMQTVGSDVASAYAAWLMPL